jgi:hypothetical protein
MKWEDLIAAARKGDWEAAARAHRRQVSDERRSRVSSCARKLMREAMVRVSRAE